MLVRVSLPRSRSCAGAGCGVSGRPGSQRIRRAAVPNDPLYPPVPTVDESIKPVVESFRADAVPEQQATIQNTNTRHHLPAARGEPQNVSVLERIGNGAVFGLTAFFAGTFLVSLLTYVHKYNKPDARARRKLLKNQRVVRTLGEQLPAHRDQVTRGMLRQLGFVTGFSPVEIFRKFLWYVLKDRKFDQAAVDDLVHLKQVMALSNEDVAEALRERCIRIEKKFGNLMLSPEGLSEKAVQRKATCRALFSKMLYLIDNEQIMQDNEVLSVDTLRNIFGATEDDINQLKIVSLQEVDLDVLDSMVGKREDA